METLTIEIPDKEAKIFKEISKKFNVKIVKTKVTELPNALTVKTIKAAHNGKDIGKPIKNVRSFIDSLRLFVLKPTNQFKKDVKTAKKRSGIKSIWIVAEKSL